MTLNPEIRELTTDELEQAAGGFIDVLIGLGLIAVGGLLYDYGSHGAVGSTILSPAATINWEHPGS